MCNLYLGLNFDTACIVCHVPKSFFMPLTLHMLMQGVIVECIIKEAKQLNLPWKKGVWH